MVRVYWAAFPAVWGRGGCERGAACMIGADGSGS